jgi:propionate CoA-transferase
VDGEEFLFYRAFPINVGIIRGTTADPDGNITMEKESADAGGAGHRHGGAKLRRLVIVQVEGLPAGSLNPRQVKIRASL